MIENKYNPENKTQSNIVPALAGVILTMTMVMVTSLTITREKEYGTMESLLATPVTSLEIIFGKITPYILVGYIQLLLIIFFAKVIFGIAIVGSILLLLLATLPFILANLLVGITFSTVAATQLQAMQMTFFFFLPSILLSGFMFPFDGMPEWAQIIGNIFTLVQGSVTGTCKVRNEIETKRNQSKRNETNRNETKPIETKRNQTKRNQTKLKFNTKMK